MSELPGTLTELQALLAQGALSPAESLHIQRQRISAFAGLSNGFVDVFDESQPCKAPTPGELSGIGLAHKDIFALKGRSPGLGVSHGHANDALQNASCIEVLHQSGATHFGALHMAPFACGATSRNEYLGECINPLDSERVVGGSSSGSAVAVARELCFASLGTDTAGSIRIPAATCGLLGLKTTAGLIDQTGVSALAPALDSVGLIARSIPDMETLVQLLMPYGSKRGPQSTPALWPAKDIERIHCWLPAHLLDTSVAEHMLEVSKSLQHVVVSERFEEESALSALAEVVLYQQVAQTHLGVLQSNSTERPCPKALGELVMLGECVPRHWAQQAFSSRGMWLQRFIERYLSDHEMFMMPAIGIELPQVSEVCVSSAQFTPKKLLALHRFMGFVNYLGLPSLVLPVGRDANGMPISVQVVCRPYQELSLLRWAKSFVGARFGTQCVSRVFASID